MADDTPTPKKPTKAETQAAVEKLVVETTPMRQEEETAMQLDEASQLPTDELHQVADLMAAGPALFGVPQECVAGAAHLAGLEMTTELAISAMAQHIQAYLAQPA